MEQQTHFRIRSLSASSDYNCICDEDYPDGKDGDVPMILDKVILCQDKLGRLLLEEPNQSDILEPTGSSWII